MTSSMTLDGGVLLLVALLVLSVLVLVHELGHFLAAKLCGVRVEEFGIGLPPRIWGKKIGKTLYSVNALPIGGFVRLYGEVGSGDDLKYPKRAFVNKSKFSRAFVALAGISMNFLFAVLCFTLIYFSTGISRGVRVVETVSESPAKVSGILPEDSIVRVGGDSVVDTDKFTSLISKNRGKNVNISLTRDLKGQKMNVDVIVNIPSEPLPGGGYLGVSFAPAEVYFPPAFQRPFVFTKYGLEKTYEVSRLTWDGLMGMFSKIFSGSVPKGVTGPVGVTAVIAEVARLGFLPLVELAGIISINLALLNLVPFPPLDGSRVMFLFVEAIVGKRKLPKFEEKIHIVGMGILLVLMLFITANEIPKFIRAGSLTNFVNGLLE